MRADLEEYADKKRMKTLATAVRELINLGLAAHRAGVADALTGCSDEEFEQIRATLKEFEPLPE